MSVPSKPAGRHHDIWSDPRLVAPSAERWAAMSADERDREEERILDALDEYREAMAEGTPHSRAKYNAYRDLSDHFKRAGRRVFLATELYVLYPGEPAIVPDLLAVMDVEDPERERNSWRVPEEGRGIDMVLELRNLGMRHRDLADNVEHYARLGIAEYFSYDCRSKRLRAWRLPHADARAYTSVVPQGGRLFSPVLGLEVGVAEGRLRFFKDSGQIPTSEELVGQLQKKIDAQLNQLDEAFERLESTRVGLVEVVLGWLTGRGLVPTELQLAEVKACQDIPRLLRWLERARSASAVEDILSE